MCHTSYNSSLNRPIVFLAAIMLQWCVCLSSSVTLSIVAKLCVLEQKLLLKAYVVYEKSTDTKMNDLDLCLEVVSRSRQPLRYIQRWISRKPLEIEAWFHRTTNRKWPTGNQMVTWLTTSRWPRKVKHVNPICVERNISEMLFSNNR